MGCRVETEWIKGLGEVFGGSVIWVEIKPSLKPGQNFGSQLTKLTVAYRRKENKMENTVELILKQNSYQCENEIKTSLNNYFCNEIKMYKEVFPIYLDLTKSGGDNLEKLWPTCYFVSSRNSILMEDLHVSGFERARCSADKMPMSHINLALESLGKLHGLSFVATLQGLLPSLSTNNTLFFTEPIMGDNFVKTGINRIVDAIEQTWSNDWQFIGEKLKKLEPLIMKELRQLERESTRLKVLNHGDTWINNVFFKYENDTPIDIRWLDFQNPHYGSFGFDLAHFLTASSITPDIYIKSNCFQIYCDSFKGVLSSANVDTGLCPTEEECIAEMNRLKAFSLAVACTVLPLAIFDCDGPAGIEDLVGMGPSRDDNNAPYRKKGFAMIFQHMWPYFESVRFSDT